jgi:hypothetical protein
MAQSGHPDALDQCPFLGVKRTFSSSVAMSVYDFSEVDRRFVPDRCAAPAPLDFWKQCVRLEIKARRKFCSHQRELEDKAPTILLGQVLGHTLFLAKISNKTNNLC